MDISTRPRFHLAMPVDDLDAARAFYGARSGARRVAATRRGSIGISAAIRSSPIFAASKVERIHNPVDGHDVPVPHFGLILTIDDFHQLPSRLRERRYRIRHRAVRAIRRRDRRAVDDVLLRPGRQRDGVQGIRRRAPDLRGLISVAVDASGVDEHCNATLVDHRALSYASQSSC